MPSVTALGLLMAVADEVRTGVSEIAVDVAPFVDQLRAQHVIAPTCTAALSAAINQRSNYHMASVGKLTRSPRRRPDPRPLAAGAHPAARRQRVLPRSAGARDAATRRHLNRHEPDTASPAAPSQHGLPGSAGGVRELFPRAIRSAATSPVVTIGTVAKRRSLEVFLARLVRVLRSNGMERYVVAAGPAPSDRENGSLVEDLPGDGCVRATAYLRRC